MKGAAAQFGVDKFRHDQQQPERQENFLSRKPPLMVVRAGLVLCPGLFALFFHSFAVTRRAKCSAPATESEEFPK